MISRIPLKHRNAPVSRERDPLALMRLALLLLSGLILAGGFVYAGGQHFAALRLGYETEKLRARLNEARETQRRLLLEREAAVSPAKLELAARRLGLQPMQASQIDPLKRLNKTSGQKTDTSSNGSVAEAKLKPSKQIKTR